VQPNASVDVAVVGAGPAGLSLAAALGNRGLTVALIAPDTPFCNNYGVWYDEFEDLGLSHTLKNKYDDVLVWMHAEPNNIGGTDLGRAYAQVDRKKLRVELLQRCKDAGVLFHNALVENIDNEEAHSTVTCADGLALTARVVSTCTGHNREMVKYNNDQTPYGWQTAYGVEVSLKDHPFPLNKAVFMDFRQSDEEPTESADYRAPSFLYVLPADKDTVFLEETCLASSVQVPFDELKRRLYKRLGRMGLKFDTEDILEEEASWIPLGGPLPSPNQPTIPFGAAAVMVHPASGYSIVNTLRNADPVAEAIVSGLRDGGVQEASDRAYKVLWSGEKQRQMAFHQFGMELIMKLTIKDLSSFFTAFYALPRNLNQKFLSHDLNSAMLIYFALQFFKIGNNNLRYLLTAHLATDPGARFAQIYLDTMLGQSSGTTQQVDAIAQKSVNRKSPPQLPASTLASTLQQSNEAEGYTSGLQG